MNEQKDDLLDGGVVAPCDRCQAIIHVDDPIVPALCDDCDSGRPLP